MNYSDPSYPAIESDYVDALLELSTAYYRKSNTITTPEGSPRDEYWHRARASWNRVKVLAPDHPTLLAWEAWDLAEKGDLGAAARLMERALELYPRDWGIGHTAAIFCRYIGRNDVAVRITSLAQERDPLCNACNYHYARSLLGLGRYAEAYEAIEKFRALAPGSGGQITAGKALMELGDFDGALKEFEKRAGEADVWYGPLLLCAYRGEDTSDDLASLVAAGKMGDQEDDYFALAELYAVSGNTDEAFRWLEQGEAVTMAFFRPLNSPYLANLHDDPRWHGYLERAGIASHQLAEVNFDPQLPD